MEDKFRDFLTLNEGKFIERVDSSNLNQCFDLAIAWCEWLGLPTNIFSGLLYAYQIYTSPTPTTQANFDIIPNTPEGMPQVGDIVVFSNKFGSAGHVVIATGEGDLDTFKAFSQNDPLGSPCIVKTYNYDFVLGWLRFKGNELQECLRQHTLLVNELESVKKSNASKDEVIKSLNQNIQDRNTQIVSLEAEKKGLAEQLTNCQNTSQLHLEQAKKVAEMTIVCQEQEIKIIGLNSDIERLKDKVNGHKSRWLMLRWSLKKIILEKVFPNLIKKQ